MNQNEKDQTQTTENQAETEPRSETEKNTVFLEESTVKLIAAGAKKMGMDPEEFLNKTVGDYLKRLKQIYPNKPIEKEQITLNLPKQVLDWYRLIAKTNGAGLEAIVEQEVIDATRSSFEGMDGKILTQMLNLEQVFEENAEATT